MKNILVLLNGIQMPYHVIEYAIEWAEQNSGSIHVILLKSSEEVEVSYPFPSDLNLAETRTNKSNARQDDEEILSTNTQLIKEMAEQRNIACTFETIIDAQPGDVAEASSHAAVLAIDADFDDEGLPLGDKNISLKNIKHEAKCPVQVISS